MPIEVDARVTLGAAVADRQILGGGTIPPTIVSTVGIDWT